MWPFSPRSHDIVGIHITDTHIRFSRMQRNGELYKLINYYEQSLNRHEIINGIPYKISHIVTYINNFIASQKLNRPLLTFALDDAWLNPHIETAIRTEPHHSNIISQHQISSNAWYTTDIAREHLFFYQLISLQLSMPCNVITTAHSAAITALTRLSPISNSEFKHDIDCDTYLQTMCTADRLQRINRNNCALSERALATALGLFIQGSEQL
jgi:hypothetical protein